MIVQRGTATVETLSYKRFVSFSILLRVHKIKTATVTIGKRWNDSYFILSSANDLPSLMEETKLLKLQAQVYQRSGKIEETLKTLTRAKEVQTR